MLAHSSYNPAEVRPNHVLHYRWSSARWITAKIRFHGGLVRSLLQLLLTLLLALGVFVNLFMSLQCKSRTTFFTCILSLVIWLAHIFSSDKNPLKQIVLYWFLRFCVRDNSASVSALRHYYAGHSFLLSLRCLSSS